MNFVNGIGIVFFAILLALPVGHAKTKEELRSEAKKLFLENQRAAAIETLSRIQPLPVKEVLQISERFLTDQAQRDFETAESQRFSGITGAEESYQAAIQTEPDNLAVRQGYFLLLLSHKRCEAAGQEQKKIEEVFPRHPRKSYFTALLALCTQAEVEVPKESWASAEILPQMYYELVIVKGLHAQQDLLGAERVLAGVKDLDQPPDMLFWSWKIRSELGKSTAEPLREYARLCRASGETERRKFKWDPYHCSELKNALESLEVLQL